MKQPQKRAQILLAVVLLLYAVFRSVALLAAAVTLFCVILAAFVILLCTNAYYERHL